MAKSTHSQEALTGTSDSYTEEEASERPFPRYNRPELGTVDQPESESEETDALDRVTEETDSESEDQEEETWDGGSSIPSSKSESKPEPSSTQHSPKAALTTDSRSNQTVQEGSTAVSTDGGTRKAEQTPSSRPRKATRANSRTARSRTTDDVDDEFDI